MARCRKDIRECIVESEASRTEDAEAYQLGKIKKLSRRPDMDNGRAYRLCNRLDRIALARPDGKYVTVFRMLEKTTNKAIATMLAREQAT
jgi:hypothetical protein